MPLRYNAVSQALHWLTAVLVIALLAIGFFIDSFGQHRGTAIALHQSLGITVLGVVMLRLLWRVRHKAPPLLLPAAQRLVASMSHTTLYVLLLVMPLLGWGMGAAFGKSVQWFNLVPLPTFATPNRALGVLCKHWHATLAWALLALIVLHTLAALYHHFICRDNVLRRMLPKMLAPLT